MTPPDIGVAEQIIPHADGGVKKLRGKYSGLEREAGITVRYDDCVEEPIPPDRFVAAFPRPWADSKWLQCQECWAREAAAEAELDEGEVLVLAAKYAGFSPPQIASAHGGYVNEVSEILADLNQRARETIDDSVTGHIFVEMLGR